MPREIIAEQMPKFTRVISTAKWAGISAYVAEWVKSHNKGDAFAVDADDGVTSVTTGGAGQAIRVAGKGAGVKFNLRFVYDDTHTAEAISKANAASPRVPLSGVLYAQHDGEYVERPREPKADAQPAKGAAKK